MFLPGTIGSGLRSVPERFSLYDIYEQESVGKKINPGRNIRCRKMNVIAKSLFLQENLSVFFAPKGIFSQKVVLCSQFILKSVPKVQLNETIVAEFLSSAF